MERIVIEEYHGTEEEDFKYEGSFIEENKEGKKVLCLWDGWEDVSIKLDLDKLIEALKDNDLIEESLNNSEYANMKNIKLRVTNKGELPYKYDLD